MSWDGKGQWCWWETTEVTVPRTFKLIVKVQAETSPRVRWTCTCSRGRRPRRPDRGLRPLLSRTRDGLRKPWWTPVGVPKFHGGVLGRAHRILRWDATKGRRPSWGVLGWSRTPVVPGSCPSFSASGGKRNLTRDPDRKPRTVWYLTVN